MRRPLALLACCALLAACAKPPPAEPPPIAQAELHPTLQLILKVQVDPKECPNAVSRCGDLVRITCKPEVDGLDAYYDNRDGNMLMACGGACLKIDSPDPVHCKQCPPKQWACAATEKKT